MAKYRISYWTFIFAITFCFQIFRAKFSDAIIFGLATVIMLLQPIHQIRNFSLPRLKMDRRTIWFLVSFLGLAIAYIPRHHQLLAAIFLALAALLFLTLWNFQDEHQSFTRLEIKSAYFWGSTAVAVSLWELSALVIAKLKHNVNAYPTISELVVPILATPVTRLQFVFGWVLLGWLVIRHWRHE